MRRFAPSGLLATLIVLAAGLPAAPAFAACGHDANGRCTAPGAVCHPPADGRCHTMTSTLTNRDYACRCVSPSQFGPSAAVAGQKSCRQRYNARDLTCEANARNFTQRNNCVSRMTTCNRSC